MPLAFVVSPLSVAMDCPLIPIPDIEDIQFKTSWKSVAEPYLARYVEKDVKEPAYEIGYLEILNAVAFTVTVY